MPATNHHDERVLVLAPLGRDGPVTAELLRERGLAADVCADAADAGRQMAAGAGVLLVTEEALEQAGASELFAQLRAQPLWSELPLIILTRGGESRLSRLLDLSAQLAGGVTLLERPLGATTLLCNIEVALRSRRRQYQVRDLLTERKAAEEKLRRVALDLESANATLRESRRAAMNLMHDAVAARKEAEQAAEALRQSQEDLTRGQEVGQMGSWRLDTGRNVLSWSPENYRIFGVPEGTSMSYESFLSMVHPDDREYVDAKWNAGLRGEPYDVEHRIVADGRVKWVREKAYLEIDREGKLLGGFGISQDITERKRAEQREQEALALAAASQTAVDVLDAMGEGVLLLDMNGRISSVNPALEKMAGVSAGELIGRPLKDLLPELLSPEDRALAEEALRAAIKGSVPELRPMTLLSRTGRRIPLIPSVTFVRGSGGKQTAIVATLRDISDLRAAQESLVESERKYRELVENANSIIMRITPEHNITFFNEYAQTFFGFTADEVLGKNVVGTIVPPVDSEGRDLRQMVREVTAQPEAHGSNENENMCKDGRRVWVHWANRAIRDEQGTVKEILCVGTDITRRREMEAESLQYQQRLRELAEKLVTEEEEDRWRISRYIHDTIVQNLSLSNIRLGSMERSLTDATLTEEADRLRQVRGLLDQAGSECRMVMTDLTPALLYELGLVPALNDLAQQLEAKHRARMIVEDDGQETPLSHPLRGLLFQSVRELVMNALKYAGPCEIRVAVRNGAGELTVSVADNGKGFDPAADARRDHQGGFGLFSIRQRLEGLGGRLDIQSAPGKGTRATIRVPVESLGQ